METVQGMVSTSFSNKLKELGDLIYHEGPLMTLFKDPNLDLFYIYKWADCDEKANRWLIFPITQFDLIMYFNQKRTLREIILNNPTVYLADLNNDLEETQFLAVDSVNIPQSYLPAQNLYFQAERFEPFVLELKSQLEKEGLAHLFFTMQKEIALLKNEQQRANSFLELLLQGKFPDSAAKLKA